MIRSMKRLAATATLAAAVVLASSAPAHAWYQVTNRSPNNVWLSHAYASTSGFLCGWNDSCPDATTSGWAVHGWWMIGPGGTAILLTQNFGNAVHQIFAFDQFGHVWEGGGGGFATPNDAFWRCQELFPDPSIPVHTYRPIRTSSCCGGSCPANGTTTLTL